MPGEDQVTWGDFGWQGLRLRVPEEWNLGKVDGNYKSGYARLDDAEIVRVELEWRDIPGGGQAVSGLVDRYLESLRKKAGKADIPFKVTRRARFLKDKRWLEDCDYETFIWEADFKAYNLARTFGLGKRVALLRVLTRFDENIEGLIEEVFRSLEDQPEEEDFLWSVYGLGFFMPAQYKLESHGLKSGHIQLNFQQDRHTVQVHRLSMANLLLKGTGLEAWYSNFFSKQLRDFNFETAPEDVGDQEGLRIEGRPRSRWRQLLRPLPFINPRPRLYLDGRIWHWEAANKIGIVEHLYKKKDEKGDLAQQVADGYIRFEKDAQADPRDHAQFAARPQ